MSQRSQENKSACQQIEKLLEQARSIYDRAKVNNSADWSQTISELNNLYQQALQLFNQMHNIDAKVFGEDWYGRAKSALTQFQKLIQQAQAQANTQGRDRASGEGLEGFENNQDLGNQLAQLGEMFPSPYLGNNPQQAALYDLYMQLSGQKQQYDWQRNADDLAYERTSFATLLAQYQAAGMSRADAMAAASGSLPSVSGSSVGGALSPNMLGAASQSQNNAVAQGNLGVARQNAATQYGSISIEQQKVANQAYAMRMQYWTTENMQHAYEVIQRTYDLTYGLHANHVDVPLDATISQKAFKDWLRDQSDNNAELARILESGEGYKAPDGAVYVDEDSYNEGDSPIIDKTEVKGYELCAELYDEIQKHKGDPFYGEMFEQQFMNNAGPRAWHEQEDYTKYQQDLMYCDQLQAKLDSVLTNLESAEVESEVHQQFRFALQNYRTANPNYYNAIMDKINHYGLVFDENKNLCWPSFEGDSAEGKEPIPPKRLSTQDMIDLGFVDVGFNYKEFYKQKQWWQAARMATDHEHFQSTMRQMRKSDRIAENQLTVQDKAWNSATVTMQSRGVLGDIINDAAGYKILWETCGFDRVAVGVGAAAVAGYKLSSDYHQRKQHRIDSRSHRITESYDKDGNLTTTEVFNVFGD